MEWLLNRFGAQTRKIWPSEAAGVLGIVVAAKAPRGLGGLSRKKKERKKKKEKSNWADVHIVHFYSTS